MKSELSNLGCVRMLSTTDKLIQMTRVIIVNPKTQTKAHIMYIFEFGYILTDAYSISLLPKNRSDTNPIYSTNTIFSGIYSGIFAEHLQI